MKRLYYNGPIITMDPAAGSERAALNAKRAITEKKLDENAARGVVN